MSNTTIIYLDTYRRDCLRAAFSDVVTYFGPLKTAVIIETIKAARKSNCSHRVNYNRALYALDRFIGVSGLPAVALIKEAWNPNSLRGASATHTTHPTHLTTSAIQ